MNKNLKWSKWYKDDITGWSHTYLNGWNGATHPKHHNVAICKYGKGYDVIVSAGAYGEVCYERQSYIKTVKEAKKLALLAVNRALENGDLTFD